MILAVEEVNLVSKFGDGLLIGLVSVLYAEHLQRLATFVQLLKSFNFIFPHVNLLFDLLKLILNL